MRLMTNEELNTTDEQIEEWYNSDSKLSLEDYLITKTISNESYDKQQELKAMTSYNCGW